MGIALEPGGAVEISAPLNTLTNRIADSATVKITRPNNTTAYTALDVVGQATGAVAGSALLKFTFPRLATLLGVEGQINAPGGEVRLNTVVFSHEAAALVSTEGSYLLYIYSLKPAGLLDNDAWQVTVADLQLRARKVAITTPTDEGAVLQMEMEGLNKQLALYNNTFYAYLITVAGYTPVGSEVYNVTCHVSMP